MVKYNVFRYGGETMTSKSRFKRFSPKTFMLVGHDKDSDIYTDKKGRVFAYMGKSKKNFKDRNYWWFMYDKNKFV